jgi:hypothetical protein
MRATWTGPEQQYGLHLGVIGREGEGVGAEVWRVAQAGDAAADRLNPEHVAELRSKRGHERGVFDKWPREGGVQRVPDQIIIVDLDGDDVLEEVG